MTQIRMFDAWDAAQAKASSDGPPPDYDLRACPMSVVADLCAKHHGYGSAGTLAVYAWAVYEDGQPVAAYAWQPPPPGAATDVLPLAPGGVLSLSRMVAVPREERRLRHVSTPLRRQMRTLIDRGRWPALVTYSDEGQGHTGHVYKCSGWTKTDRRKVPFYTNADGDRTSSYANGVSGTRDLVRGGTTTIQRWEHIACPKDSAVEWMNSHGWVRVPVRGKKWRSGNQSYTWARVPDFAGAA